MKIPNCTYSTEELVKRVAEFPNRWEEGKPRRHAVMSCLMVGSTSASAICEFAGVDPDDIKPMSEIPA